MIVLAHIAALSLTLSAGPPTPGMFGPDGTLQWNGQKLIAIDDEGVFYHGPLGAGLPAMPAPRRALQGAGAASGSSPPVRCRLVDAIDCTQSTHAFHDDGQSRVLTLAGDRYRVTAVPKGFDLKWFSFTFETARIPGRPHLLVAQLPNDQERYTTLTVSVPPDEPYPPAFRSQEKSPHDAFMFCQQPDCFHPDVGACVYNGREWPTDNRPFLFQYIFFPKTPTTKLTISSSGWTLKPTAETGAAVAKVWVFEILDPIASRRPETTLPLPAQQRRVGVYVTHPWYLLAHYGAPATTMAQRRKSLENMMDLLAFCGMNWIEFNAVNGADRASCAWYPGSYYRPLCADLLKEMPPVAEKRGMQLVPVITSLTAPEENLEDVKPNRYGFSTQSFIESGVGGEGVRAFGNRLPDPMRPEVQAWLIRHVREIAERCKSASCYQGIGFRVNGKIGLCYTSWEDRFDDRKVVRSAAEAGYSRWNLEQFRQDTGIAVPLDPTAAYAKLRADAKIWDKWLDFRCRRTRDLWLKVRDVLRSYRQDWRLYVLTDLPSEVPATNIEWPGPAAANVERITLDLIRAHGYDPRLYAKEDGIVVQRVMMLDADRYYSKWGKEWGANADRYKSFHFQSFLPEWYRTPAGGAVELYHTYWEESPHPDGEFGADGKGFGMRTATPMAIGRAFFEAATFSIRCGNVDTVALTGWQVPTLGHEHDLRRFCQAFRALPNVKPVPFDGSVQIFPASGSAGTSSGGSKPVPADETLSIRWFGDRLAIVNDYKKPRTARIRLRQPLTAGKRLRDVATGCIVLPGKSDERGEFSIELDMFDLRTLVVEAAVER